MAAFKGTKILGTLRGGVSPKATAPVASRIGTQGPRTTDPKAVNKPSMGRGGSYVRAMDKDMSDFKTTARRPKGDK